MPDTVNPLESISLIVNRHVAVADCAQSRSGRTNHRRKSSRSLTDAYNRFARHARSAKTANPWADFAEFGSTRNRQNSKSDSWGILGGNESPGVLESLRFIPQGWQRVAGGRSIAETTGMARNDNRILKGCQKRWNDVRSGSKRSGIPAGCTASFQSFRGVSAALRPPATLCHPFGMNRKSRIETVRSLSSPKIPDESKS